MATNERQPVDRSDLLHQLSMILDYWAADNSILWSRSNLFILVNSILIAFASATASGNYLPQFVLIVIVPILGVVVNMVWWLINMRSIAYIRHFEELVAGIREDLPQVRFMAPHLLNPHFSHWYQRVSSKKLFEFIPGLFLAFWLIVLIC